MGKEEDGVEPMVVVFHGRLGRPFHRSDWEEDKRELEPVTMPSD